MLNPLLDTENLKKFIKDLGISEVQEKFLFDELPSMNEKERLELLDMLKNVYMLNEEKRQSIERVKSEWKNPVKAKN